MYQSIRYISIFWYRFRISILGVEKIFHLLWCDLLALACFETKQCWPFILYQWQWATFFLLLYGGNMTQPNTVGNNNHDRIEMANARSRSQPNDTQLTPIGMESSPNHYQKLFELAPSGYLTLTEGGVIAKCNFAAADLLGIPLNKAIKSRFAQFIAPDCKDIWERHCLLAQQSERTKSCELSLLHANGILIYVQLNCIPISIAPPLLLVTLNNITEYKQADAALRIAAVAFETQDGIIVTDANKIILRVNEAFTRISGYSPEEVLGNHPFFLGKDQRNESYHQAFWLAVMNNGYWQGEVWDKRKNGEPYPIWLTLTVIMIKGEQISHYVCSFTDITAQKQAEKILLEARHGLENQATNTTEELEKVRKETAEINAALTVLLTHQESHKALHQQALSREFEETILPFLKKLKGASTGRAQSSQLLNVLETNLLQLVDSYGRTNAIPAALKKLTPIESQVAAMVRLGHPTKVIAKTLNITQGTANIHRNHIRKKLGLNNTSDNLQTYLKSLLD
jgi:PAS domain S-box-containing protein